jgi:hypothetical protein
MMRLKIWNFRWRRKDPRGRRRIVLNANPASNGLDESGPGAWPRIALCTDPLVLMVSVAEFEFPTVSGTVDELNEAEAYAGNVP